MKCLFPSVVGIQALLCPKFSACRLDFRGHLDFGGRKEPQVCLAYNYIALSEQLKTFLFRNTHCKGFQIQAYLRT